MTDDKLPNGVSPALYAFARNLTQFTLGSDRENFKVQLQAVVNRPSHRDEAEVRDAVREKANRSWNAQIDDRADSVWVGEVAGVAAANVINGHPEQREQVIADARALIFELHKSKPPS